MNPIDVNFCFYRDPDYRSDADCDSRILQGWHASLWSKPLPGGQRLQWEPKPGSTRLVHQSSLGTFEVSSDTIATTHAGYLKGLFPDVPTAVLQSYEDAFYTVGGFIIFPVHDQSINQVRGRDWRVKDRFDLTLECIRRHYLELPDNPLEAVLKRNRSFFALFGAGAEGYAAYVDFFHLDDLIEDEAIKWFDGASRHVRDFAEATLPRTEAEYLAYLDRVSAFVAARNARIASWATRTERVETTARPR